MNLVMAIATPNPYFPILSIIGIIGFIAAALIGSIAWYNSTRLTGWKGK